MQPTNSALWILAAVALIWFLKSAQQVVIPLVLSGLLFYALDPLVHWLQRWKVPRALGSAFVLIAIVGGIAFTAYDLTDEAVAVMDELPAGLRKLRNELSAAQGQPGALEKVQEAAQELDQTAAQAAGQTAAPEGVVRVQVQDPIFRASNYLWSGSIGAAELVGVTLMVLLLAYFLLVADDLFRRKLVNNISTLSSKKITVQILDEINSQIHRFLVALVLTSIVVAVVTTLALWWLGLRQAAIWGLSAGLLNSIPYFGPLIVTIGLAIVASVQFGTLGMTVAVASVALAITSIEGWILTPILMGHAARMNRIAVFVGLLFWTWMWGIWGTLLAVPMMMVMKVVCHHVEGLEPINDFLGE